VRSFRIVFSILLTLAVGLVLTTVVGILYARTFNIISIAFIALFVGLGVDFAIQFAMRYRAERHTLGALAPALSRAGRVMGLPLSLAAAATAAGFLSFLPTNYSGVAELGFIAGIGMLIAFFLTITLLPALLKVVGAPGEPEQVGFAFLKPVDAFLIRNRVTVLQLAVGAAVGALVLLPLLRFDFNPLDLRSRKAESVATLYDLMKYPSTSPNTIEVLAPSLSQSDALAKRLAAIPVVGHVLTLRSFVPDDQPAKLALIADAASLLKDTLDLLAQPLLGACFSNLQVHLPCRQSPQVLVYAFILASLHPVWIPGHCGQHSSAIRKVRMVVAGHSKDLHRLISRGTTGRNLGIWMQPEN